jgi:cytochrome c oxidase subunit IV
MNGTRSITEGAPTHGGATHGTTSGGASAHVNRREYWVVFLALAVLTAIEVGVVYLPGIGKPAMVTALIGLAVSKAALVGLFFMHLKHETRILKLTVLIPMATPAVYALVLIADAAWRLLP